MHVQAKAHASRGEWSIEITPDAKTATGEPPLSCLAELAPEPSGGTLERHDFSIES